MEPTAPAAADTTNKSPGFGLATFFMPIQAVTPVEPPKIPRLTLNGRLDSSRSSRCSIDNLEKGEKPYKELIDAEFSKIQENKNNEVNPRSHG